MEQQTGSKFEKEYVKAVYCHTAYLTYMQSTSREMPGWMKHKLESDCCKKYQQSQIWRDTTLMVESEDEQKSLLICVKENSEKAGLKLNIQKTKIMTSRQITSWQIEGETVTDFFKGAPKSLWMVTAAMKSKDSCSLKGKLQQT